MRLDYPEIKHELKFQEQIIRNNIKTRNKLLYDALSSLFISGGKRLRPAFVIICSKLGNYEREKVLSCAAAIEILHTATLIHDDIIDRSKLRRGKVTLSEKYGVDMAVYAGDFLFTKAILLFSDHIGVKKLEIIAKTIKSICEGEVDQYEARFNPEISVTDYLKRIKRKTAILFGASCALGSSMAGIPYRQVLSLGRYGSFYGMAFQIRDDLNDYISTEGISGKPVGNDLTEGLVTLPLIYAMRKDPVLREKIKNIFADKNIIKENDIRDIKEITGIVSQSSGIENAKLLLKKYIDKGLKQLKEIPDSQYKDILTSMINDLQL